MLRVHYHLISPHARVSAYLKRSPCPRWLIILDGIGSALLQYGSVPQLVPLSFNFGEVCRVFLHNQPVFQKAYSGSTWSIHTI